MHVNDDMQPSVGQNADVPVERGARYRDLLYVCVRWIRDHCFGRVRLRRECRPGQRKPHVPVALLFQVDDILSREVRLPVRHEGGHGGFFAYCFRKFRCEVALGCPFKSERLWGGKRGRENRAVGHPC